jgi:hypothetical protein
MDSKDSLVKPNETRLNSIETKPTDAKPTDAKPTDAKPTDAKPNESKPNDARSNHNEVKPSDSNSSETSTVPTTMSTVPEAKKSLLPLTSDAKDPSAPGPRSNDPFENGKQGDALAPYRSDSKDSAKSSGKEATAETLELPSSTAKQQITSDKHDDLPIQYTKEGDGNGGKDETSDSGKQTIDNVKLNSESVDGKTGPIE